MAPLHCISFEISTPLPPLHTPKIKQSIDSWIEKSPTISDCIILIFLVRFMLVVRPFNICLRWNLIGNVIRECYLLTPITMAFDAIRYDSIRDHFVYHLLYVWNYFSECRFTGPPVWQYRYLCRLLRCFCLFVIIIVYSLQQKVPHWPPFFPRLLLGSISCLLRYDIRLADGRMHRSAGQVLLVKGLNCFLNKIS